MIKLVATDIDGTLLQSGEREVPEAVFVQIDRLLKKGILFAAASGRQYSNLKNLFAPKAEEMTFLCENGAILYRKGSDFKETADAAQPRQKRLQSRFLPMTIWKF